MSCTNTTGPVDIVHPDHITPCYEKCKLLYNFKLSGIAATNKNNYLSIEPSDKTSTSVIYSSSDVGNCNNGGTGNYGVEEIRIFHPSLHTYQGSKAEGEVIIYLNNMSGGRNLIICIPITLCNMLII